MEQSKGVVFRIRCSGVCHITDSEREELSDVISKLEGNGYSVLYGGHCIFRDEEKKRKYAPPPSMAIGNIHKGISSIDIIAYDEDLTKFLEQIKLKWRY